MEVDWGVVGFEDLLRARSRTVGTLALLYDVSVDDSLEVDVVEKEEAGERDRLVNWVKG